MWKTIKEFPEYQISDVGEVKSYRCGKTTILKPGIRNGYPYVDLCQNGKPNKCYIHRLVLSAYKGPCPKGLEANHLDGDKRNSQLDNLEWVTSSENTIHAYQNGLQARPCGKPTCQFTKDGQFVAKYRSGCEADRRTGIDQSNISACCLGKLRSAGGFIWRFANAS